MGEAYGENVDIEIDLTDLTSSHFLCFDLTGHIGFNTTDWHN